MTRVLTDQNKSVCHNASDLVVYTGDNDDEKVLIMLIISIVIVSIVKIVWVVVIRIFNEKLRTGR